MTSLTFYFDPGCPFTWITSRWLVDAAPRAGVDLHWRAFALSLINEGRDVPEEFLPRFAASNRALRVVESLVAEGRGADAANFYTEYGTREFVQGEPTGDDLAMAAGAVAGIDDVAARLDDESADALVRAAFEEIRPLVGADVGSPAIRLDGTDRAIFGPVVSPAPKGDDADRLLEAVLAVLQLPMFFELKRTRVGDLDFS